MMRFTGMPVKRPNGQAEPFRARKEFSSGVIEGLNNKAKIIRVHIESAGTTRVRHAGMDPRCG